MTLQIGDHVYLAKFVKNKLQPRFRPNMQITAQGPTPNTWIISTEKDPMTVYAKYLKRAKEEINHEDYSTRIIPDSYKSMDRSAQPLSDETHKENTNEVEQVVSTEDNTKKASKSVTTTKRKKTEPVS